MALREAPRHEGTQVEVTSENSRKAEEQREPHTRGDTHTQETGTTLQEFKALCARSESASETGFAIRGSEKKKNGPRREAANIPPRSQNQRKGKRRRAGLLAFHRLPYFWILQETAAAARAPGQTIPGLTAAFSLQPQLPSQPSLGVGGLS